MSCSQTDRKDALMVFGQDWPMGRGSREAWRPPQAPSPGNARNPPGGQTPAHLRSCRRRPPDQAGWSQAQAMLSRGRNVEQFSNNTHNHARMITSHKHMKCTQWMSQYCLFRIIKKWSYFPSSCLKYLKKNALTASYP